MGYTKLSDVYNYPEVKYLIGADWLNQSKFIASGIVRRDPRPMKGTEIAWLVETSFENTSAQRVAEGAPVSLIGHSQAQKKHPIIWATNGSQEPDVIREIEEKEVDGYNANLADKIRKACTDYADSDLLSVVKGCGAALTANQVGAATAQITLDDILLGKDALGENCDNLVATAMNSRVYWRLAKIGLSAATANTFGIALQQTIVERGQLPMNVLGMIPILSDKLAAYTTNKYYIYLLGRETVIMRGADVPEVKGGDQVPNGIWGTVTIFKTSYALGVDGLTWGGSSSTTTSSTDLETSANWTLYKTSAKNVALARVAVLAA